MLVDGLSGKHTGMGMGMDGMLALLRTVHAARERRRMGVRRLMRNRKMGQRLRSIGREDSSLRKEMEGEGEGERDEISAVVISFEWSLVGERGCCCLDDQG